MPKFETLLDKTAGLANAVDHGAGNAESSNICLNSMRVLQHYVTTLPGYHVQSAQCSDEAGMPVLVTKKPQQGSCWKMLQNVSEKRRWVRKLHKVGEADLPGADLLPVGIPHVCQLRLHPSPHCKAGVQGRCGRWSAESISKALCCFSSRALPA